MAKFVYRMQNILDIKQKLEEQEKANLGLATARYNEEQMKLREVIKRQADYERQLRDLSLGTLNINEIKSCKQSITSMKVLVRDQMIAVSKAQKQMEAVRKRLNEVMMDRKMHEKLREKEFDKFLQELNYEEGKLTDELASYTYFNTEEE